MESGILMTYKIVIFVLLKKKARILLNIAILSHIIEKHLFEDKCKLISISEDGPAWHFHND